MKVLSAELRYPIGTDFICREATPSLIAKKDCVVYV